MGGGDPKVKICDHVVKERPLIPRVVKNFPPQTNAKNELETEQERMLQIFLKNQNVAIKKINFVQKLPHRMMSIINKCHQNQQNPFHLNSKFHPSIICPKHDLLHNR